jgi:hypothetical protein
VVPGEDPELILDPTQPEGRTARLLVREALERAAGRKDALAFRTSEVKEPGSRYIDFLIPGLLGMGLMMSSAWGLGWSIVEMRTGKLLKRLRATPMKRSHFLLSFVLSRTLLTGERSRSTPGCCSASGVFGSPAHPLRTGSLARRAVIRRQPRPNTQTAAG